MHKLKINGLSFSKTHKSAWILSLHYQLLHSSSTAGNSKLPGIAKGGPSTDYTRSPVDGISTTTASYFVCCPVDGKISKEDNRICLGESKKKVIFRFMDFQTNVLLSVQLPVWLCQIETT